MSMAGLLNVLSQLRNSGNTNSPVLQTATKHWDEIIVSRYYNWRPGSWQGIYTHAGFYKLRADAPSNAVETLSKNLIAPLLEKLFADGVIYEYEIDTEAVHTDAPGRFWIFCLAANGEAIDKINAAIQDATKANPFGGVAFNSMVEGDAHRDYMALASGRYK